MPLSCFSHWATLNEKDAAAVHQVTWWNGKVFFPVKERLKLSATSFLLWYATSPHKSKRISPSPCHQKCSPFIEDWWAQERGSIFQQQCAYSYLTKWLLMTTTRIWFCTNDWEMHFLESDVHTHLVQYVPFSHQLIYSFFVNFSLFFCTFQL